jgi:ferritin-like metal-binding protein YciE
MPKRIKTTSQTEERTMENGGAPPRRVGTGNGRRAGRRAAGEGAAAGPTQPLEQDIEGARRELDAALREVRAFRERAEAAAREVEEHACATREQAEEARQQFEEAQRDLADAQERLRWLDQEARLEEERCRQELGRFLVAFQSWGNGLRVESEETRQRLAAARLTAVREGEEAPAAAEPVGEETAGVAVVQAAVRLEPAQDRVARYLNNAWAIEDGHLDALKTMVEEVIDPALRDALAEQGQTTRRQKLNLEERLRELGRSAPGGKGLFARLLAGIWGGMGRPADDYDRTMQHVMKAYGAAHFQVAMYRILAAIAAAAGDQATLALAGLHLDQEEVAAKKLEAALVPLAAMAAELPRAEAPAEK